MDQVKITRKPPHYLPEIPGKFFSGISGNNYLLHYLSEIFVNLICNSFGAHSTSTLWADSRASAKSSYHNDMALPQGHYIVTSSHQSPQGIVIQHHCEQSAKTTFDTCLRQSSRCAKSTYMPQNSYVCHSLSEWCLTLHQFCGGISIPDQWQERQRDQVHLVYWGLSSCGWVQRLTSQPRAPRNNNGVISCETSQDQPWQRSWLHWAQRSAHDCDPT